MQNFTPQTNNTFDNSSSNLKSSQSNSNFDTISANSTDIAIDANLNIENKKDWEKIIANYINKDYGLEPSFEINPNIIQPQILSTKPDEE